MNSMVSGIVLEGLSTAGKTSVLKEIKKVQAADTESERSVVVLGEHYSQQLQLIHGKETSLSVSSHGELLGERIRGIEVLNSWATELGPHRRTSRGLFYLFERFHLNHRHSYPESSYIENIEERLCQLCCKCVVLTVSSEKIEQRLSHRSNGSLAGRGLTKAAAEFLRCQEHLIECAEKSVVPYTLLNTNEMSWKDYAVSILQTVR